MNDRRTHTRYECSFPVKIVTAIGEELEVVSIDISHEGMGVAGNRWLITGQIVQLAFRPPLMEADTKVTARVCWSAGDFAGLQFIGEPPVATIEFIRHTDQGKLVAQ